MKNAVRPFLHIKAVSGQKKAQNWDYALLLFRMTSRVVYSAQYNMQHCTLHAFEQFVALYIHNHDDKYPARPVFEHGTCRLQAPVDTNEPSGSASNGWKHISLKTCTRRGLISQQTQPRSIRTKKISLTL